MPEHKATIYTKGGDKGETGLPGKRRLPKRDQIFEVLGNLDQTNASIGVAISHLSKEDKEVKTWLNRIQKNVFELGSCLACENPADAAIIKRLPKETEEMELQIDAWDKQMPPLKNFILPGGSTAGASLHFSRTLVRQSERAYHRLGSEYKLSEISIYINRLSDFFFEMARFINYCHKQQEEIWTQEK